MKTIAYCALHYGSDYLAYAIRSVIDHVDEVWILYSAQGSHGHQTDLVCPDHAADLYTIAKGAAGDKLCWYTASPGQWRTEGEQREYIHQLVPDADVILVLDADEVWSDGTVEYALLAARYEQARTYRIPMVHYWRSFNRVVLHDPAYPIRIILPKVRSGEETLDTSIHYGDPAEAMGDEYIHHFGYAQRSEIVRYKLSTHGHKNELRPDWYEARFAVNAQEDTHPVGSEYWTPETVDPYALGLPVWMKEHPFSQLDIIP